jgi:predicted nucleic acid-binding protein
VRSAVSDSGPFIHLAILQHVNLLPRYFAPVLTLPQVYEEVVTHGSGRPGARELATACERDEVRLVEISDARIIEHVRHMPADIPPVSDVDLLVLALAIEQRAVLLTDDNALRKLARAHGVPVIGSIGILIRARLGGVIAALKPLLDQLVAAGFHLDPQGQIYHEALARVDEDASYWSASSFLYIEE